MTSGQLLWGAASVFCQRQRAFLIVDPRDDWNTVNDVAAGIAGVRIGAAIDYAGIYWPRIKVASVRLPIDPAGTIAGIMARTDTQHGVWKAAAGSDVLNSRRNRFGTCDFECGKWCNQPPGGQRAAAV